MEVQEIHLGVVVARLEMVMVLQRVVDPQMAMEMMLVP